MLVLMSRWLRLLVWALVLVSVPALSQEPYAVEPVTATPSAYLPDSLVRGLNPEGSRLITYINGLKTTVCEVWWARNVLTQESSSAATKGSYGNLKVGGLVGVIRYLADSGDNYREDSRDQKLRPGYYTMRYAQMPEDASHQGVNPYRDFVLLSPVSVDRNPEKVPNVEELLRVSRFASRTSHPAVLTLVPATDAPPGVRTDDAGSCILQAKLQVRPDHGGPSHEMQLAIVLVTPAVQDGAS